MATINQQHRRQINQNLGKNIQCYHDSIPVEEINRSLMPVGFELVCEDGTPFEGTFCGEQGSTLPRVAQLGAGMLGMIDNAGIALSWYKMPSGRLEIVCYLS